MKVSQKPTIRIAVKAVTVSEWDSVDFVILTLNAEWIALVQERLRIVESVVESKNFFNISWWDCPDGWYVHNQDDEEESHIPDTSCLVQDKQFQEYGWCYVELTDVELEHLRKPEQVIDVEEIKIFDNGSAQFVGNGKHTSEEFYTNKFPIGSIGKAYEGSGCKSVED